VFKLDPLQRRRLDNFRSNRRARWSLWIFAILFLISLLAPLIANDKPLLISYKGEFYTPIKDFYPETTFGGDFEFMKHNRRPPHRGRETGSGLMTKRAMLPLAYCTAFASPFCLA